MSRRDLDLIRTVDEALRGDAFDLLAYASSVLEMLRRPLDADGNGIEGLPTLAETVDRTLDDAVRQSDALLLAMAVLLDAGGPADAELAARIRAEAGGRWRTLPGWLAAPAAPEITGVASIDHALGADGTILVGTTLPDGAPLTGTVFIDRDGGSTVDDAFVAAETLADALAAGTKGVDPAEYPVTEVSPADARERIRAAVAADLALEAQLVTESWPACRPLLAWILHALPEGGSGYPRAAEDAALDDDLVAAVEARVPGSADAARLLIALNRAHSGGGDPLRWSDTFAEDLLLELLPDAVADDGADPEALLGALPALVEEAHARSAVDERLTALTLEAIGDLAGDFLDLVAMDADEELPHDDPGARELSLLALRVGGRRQLDALDAVPMTRVVADLRHLDDRARAGLESVRGLIERAGGEVFDDPEIVAAALRIADLLAETEPRLFAKGKPELAAAAIAWIAGAVNDAFAPAGAAAPAALMTALGLRGSSPVARAGSYLAALGVDDPAAWAEFPYLQDPSLLAARTRREIIRRRDAAKSASGA
ncbi:hypothetical protein B5M43_013650 [Microbacterium sp. MEC084]|uniref:hypothetical protein n=1 Tax=Microbacterium sp. MEC084 TaxID=1963027 RepID=UPI001E2FCB97|nr:hypothetical protein [Microbacterium sp. MEC084]MCD1269868.1 hypothetical protein [Microbacterium sp. MEC084]